MTFLSVIAHVITFQLRLWISGPDWGKAEHQNAALLLLCKNGLLICQKFLKYHAHSPLLLFPLSHATQYIVQRRTQTSNPFTVVGILPF